MRKNLIEISSISQGSRDRVETEMSVEELRMELNRKVTKRQKDYSRKVKHRNLMLSFD